MYFFGGNDIVHAGKEIPSNDLLKFEVEWGKNCDMQTDMISFACTRVEPGEVLSQACMFLFTQFGIYFDYPEALYPKVPQIWRHPCEFQAFKFDSISSGCQYQCHLTLWLQADSVPDLTVFSRCQTSVN